MKRFMYFAIGVLCLALAMLLGFHMGSRDALAQSNAIASYSNWSFNYHYVMLTNGDLYRRNDDGNGNFISTPAQYIGNFWSGGPVPTASTTLGSVKANYKK